MTPERMIEYIVCSNCRTSRGIGEDCMVEECPGCGDDEFDFFEEFARLMEEMGGKEQ